MATIEQLQATVCTEDRPTVVMDFDDYEHIHLTCVECKARSQSVCEYDQQGLVEVTEWGAAHVCAVPSTERRTA